MRISGNKKNLTNILDNEIYGYQKLNVWRTEADYHRERKKWKILHIGVLINVC